MKQSLSLAVAALAAILVLAVSACSGGGSDPDSTATNSGAEIISVVLAKGRAPETSLPIDPTSVFAPNTREIWGIVTLKGLDDDLEVTGVWSFLGANGQNAPREITRASVNQPPADKGPDIVRRVGLFIRKPTDFDQGVYQLDVLLGGDSQVKLQFSVVPPPILNNPATPATGTQTTAAATPTPVSGVLASPTSLPTPGRPPGGRYTVQSGDTLAFLAGLWGVSVDAVADFNDLGDGSLIIAGEVLLIPELVPPTPVATATLPPATATSTPVSTPTGTPSATVTPAGAGTPTPTRTPTP